MPWTEILTAIALVCVLEGLLPFASPRKYREMVAELARLSDNSLRSIGLAVILVGLVILYVVR
ncbi:MAG: DUF2065 domain-containing protein [Woeseiaceae bacterium]|nr:DUF2065 domain-containing protein [Woeseiaceae bacterium]